MIEHKLILAVTTTSPYFQENDQPVDILPLTIDYRLLEESNQWHPPGFLTLLTLCWKIQAKR